MDEILGSKQNNNAYTIHMLCFTYTHTLRTVQPANDED